MNEDILAMSDQVSNDTAALTSKKYLTSGKNEAFNVKLTNFCLQFNVYHVIKFHFNFYIS